MNPRFRQMIPVVVGLVAMACGDGFGPITELPRALTTAEQALVEVDNRFALKLFREIAAQEQPAANIFVSPLSVAMALGMTYNGARGATRDSMKKVLELQGMNLQEMNESYRGLIDLLQGLDPNVEWTLANSIWYDLTLPVRQEFLDLNQEYFDAEVAGLDFASPDAAPTINNWVNEATRGRIPDIVDDPMDPDLVMFLINAIYYKASWTHEFDKDLTQPSPFRLADGSQVDAPTMTHGEEVPLEIYYGNGVTVGDLSYSGGAYRMTVVVPTDASAIDDVVQDLTPDQWAAWISGLQSVEMHVRLPKYTLEYEIQLEDVLTTLGMGIAFVRGGADLSGIAGQPGDLFIDHVKHKTFVEVNEEGTEAAAATSVGVGLVSLPPTFTIDRPFIFVIRERLSGTILFMGRIMDPTAT